MVSSYLRFDIPIYVVRGGAIRIFDAGLAQGVVPFGSRVRPTKSIVGFGIVVEGPHNLLRNAGPGPIRRHGNLVVDGCSLEVNRFNFISGIAPRGQVAMGVELFQDAKDYPAAKGMRDELDFHLRTNLL